jgi:hypothetical protein
MNLLRNLYTNGEKNRNNRVLYERTTKAGAQASRFMELNKSITGRLQTIQQLLNECQATGNRGKSNPMEIIKLHTELRDQIRIVEEEWNTMDAIHKNEFRNNKSNCTIQELEIQGRHIQRLQIEIDNVKDIQFSTYTKITKDKSITNQQTSSIVQAIKIHPEGMSHFMSSFDYYVGAIC